MREKKNIYLGVVGFKKVERSVTAPPVSSSSHAGSIWACVSSVWGSHTLRICSLCQSAFYHQVPLHHVRMVSSISSLESGRLAIFFRERRWHSDSSSLLAESRMAAILWWAEKTKRVTVNLRRWLRFHYQHAQKNGQNSVNDKKYRILQLYETQIKPRTN